MKNIVKILSLEQKITIVDFVTKWIKNGKDLTEGVGTTYIIKEGKIIYMISMDIFSKDHISSILVMNYDLDISISVDVKNLPKQSLLDVQFIENHIQKLRLVLGAGQDLTDKEFNTITNLEPDITLSRSKKIKHIQDKM